MLTSLLSQYAGRQTVVPSPLVRPAVLAALLTLGLIGCTQEAPPPSETELVRPVRVVTIEPTEGGERVVLTGQVEAQDEVSLAFRIAGRMTERTVNVGDRVTAGQLIGRLEPDTWRDALQTARADLAAARARLVETRNQFQRFQALIADGFITRAMFDESERAFRSAEAQVDAAEARVSTAETQLSYTELFADSNGTVTARGAEPGEVIAAGQMIVQLAREGGRDAVFDVPARVMQRAHADLAIEVALSDDPTVLAMGRVREVSPQADPVTRTFKVRIGLIDPPRAMRLGSTVTGTTRLGGGAGIEIPAAALTAANGQPAVWILDPATSTVALRNVEVARSDLARVALVGGVEVGEILVTAGVQTLRPGQRVRLLGAQP